MSTETTPTRFTGRRDYVLNEILYMLILYMSEEYPELRSSTSTIETKDQESVVLTAAKTTPAGEPGNL